MGKLIIFGCSLSASGHVTSWPQRVSEITGLECVNLAVPASSNQLQVQRFKEYVLDNQISSNDIIIWQITSIHRFYKRVTPNLNLIQKFIKWTKLTGNLVFESNRKNYFDGKTRYDYLCHHPDNIDTVTDEAELLEDLIFVFTVARQFTKNLIVLIGWKEALPDAYYDKFISVLKERDFNYVEEHILEHSKHNHFPLADDSHPKEEGYISFADNCVTPKLKELGLI